MEGSLAPADALRAADHLCLLRETTRAVAAQQDLVVSFTPKPYIEHFAGNGLHLHRSLWDAETGLEAGANCFYDADSGVLKNWTMSNSAFLG